MVTNLSLAEWYGPLRQAHISLVGISALLFIARGVGVLASGAWPMRASARRASVAVDTALLAAALALWAMLGLNPVRDAWLGSKLGLLLIYIVLGSLALKRARRARVRLVCFVLALAVLATMASVAMTRSPYGWLRTWAAPGESAEQAPSAQALARTAQVRTVRTDCAGRA